MGCVLGDFIFYVVHDVFCGVTGRYLQCEDVRSMRKRVVSVMDYPSGHGL